MKARWIAVAVALTLAAPSLVHAATCADLSGAPDVFDDFEDFLEDTAQDGSETFSLGTPPGTAVFDGDQWRGIGFIPELYFGARAWMVLESGSATVTFDPPASEVKFYAKTHSASTGNTTVESLDGSQSVIDTVVLPAGMASFQVVCLTGSRASSSSTTTSSG